MKCLDKPFGKVMPAAVWGRPGRRLAGPSRQERVAVYTWVGVGPQGVDGERCERQIEQDWM